MLDEIRASGLAKMVRHGSQPTRTTPSSATERVGPNAAQPIEYSHVTIRVFAVILLESRATGDLVKVNTANVATNANPRNDAEDSQNLSLIHI